MQRGAATLGTPLTNFTSYNIVYLSHIVLAPKPLRTNNIASERAYRVLYETWLVPSRLVSTILNAESAYDISDSSSAIDSQKRHSL